MVNRSKAPLPEKKFSFKTPDIKRLDSRNGIEVSLIQKEKLPIVYAEVIIFSGSRFDPPDKKGLAYLTSLLIDEGAAEYDALQLSEEFEKLGTSFSISADHDTTIFSILSLKEYFERSLELLSKVIIEPRFEEKDFEREKKKVLNRILQLKDEPAFIASSAFERRVFGETFYGFPEIGFEKNVSSISNSDVKYFFNSAFSSLNTKIVIVGNINSDESGFLLNKYFSNRQSNSIKEIEFQIPKRTGTKFYFVHKADSAQSEIRIGHVARKRNSEDFIPTRVMNSILGGQFSSRINLNLREKKGFTYGAGSSFNYYKETGLFEVSTAVNIEYTGEAIAEILNELNLIRENISHEEIEFAKSYLIKQYPSRFETYIQVAKNLEGLIIHSLPFDELINYTRKLESTTDEQIRESAINNIFPEELIIVAVGDKKKIFDQLKKTAGKDPIELTLTGELIT